jgi:hypothetical protein
VSQRRVYKWLGFLKTHWKYRSYLVAQRGYTAYSKKNDIGGFLEFGVTIILDCSFPFPKERSGSPYCSVKQHAV